MTNWYRFQFDTTVDLATMEAYARIVTEIEVRRAVWGRDFVCYIDHERREFAMAFFSRKGQIVAYACDLVFEQTFSRSHYKITLVNGLEDGLYAHHIVASVPNPLPVTEDI